ncbi:hypothetical protein RYX36_019677 [Vicia faba]
MILVASLFGWCYRACHLCPCISRGDTPLFECDIGHSTEAEICRYKIEIQVFHGGSSCKFVFWNRECELLLGLSAPQLCHTMIKARIDYPLEFPLALDQLLNLEMEFKVKWQSRWNNCSVVSILMDEPFIRQLKAPWDIDEVKESVDEAKTGVPKDCV